VRFKVCSLTSLIDNYWMDNLRLRGALRWKVETAGWEGWRGICRKPARPRL
jgi:hypothetical protein